MNTIDKILNGSYSLEEFTQEQKNYITGLVARAYEEGKQEGKSEVTNKIFEVLNN